VGILPTSAVELSSVNEGVSYVSGAESCGHYISYYSLGDMDFIYQIWQSRILPIQSHVEGMEGEIFESRALKECLWCNMHQVFGTFSVGA